MKNMQEKEFVSCHAWNFWGQTDHSWKMKVKTACCK